MKEQWISLSIAPESTEKLGRCVFYPLNECLGIGNGLCFLRASCVFWVWIDLIFYAGFRIWGNQVFHVVNVYESLFIFVITPLRFVSKHLPPPQKTQIRHPLFAPTLHASIFDSRVNSTENGINTTETSGVTNGITIDTTENSGVTNGISTIENSAGRLGC